jgi:hypothetical protein
MMKIRNHVVGKGNRVFEVGPKAWSNDNTYNTVTFEGDDAEELYKIFKNGLNTEGEMKETKK